MKICVICSNRSQPEQIIDICVMQLCKTDQDISWDVSLPELIVAVYLLGAVEIGCHILLLHICILAKIADSLVDHTEFLLDWDEFNITHCILLYSFILHIAVKCG